MTTECYNINCPKHGELKDGPFADCDLVCPEDGLVEGAKNTEQANQPDSGKQPSQFISTLCGRLHSVTASLITPIGRGGKDDRRW